MISSIMSDQNLEDGDIKPSSKLIEVVFQNCRSQVDHWVKLYLKISVERLRTTEKPYQKCLLMQVLERSYSEISMIMISIIFVESLENKIWCYVQFSFDPFFWKAQVKVVGSIPSEACLSPWSHTDLE